MKTVSSLTVSSHDFTAVVKEQLTRLQTFITDTLRVLETPIDTVGITTQLSSLPSTSQSSPLPSTLPEDVAQITTQLSPLPSTLPEDVAYITTQLSSLPSTLPEVSTASEKEIVKKRKPIKAAPIPTQGPSIPTPLLTSKNNRVTAAVVTGTTEKSTEVS